MTDVMQSLYQDHANLAEITDIARQELKSLEAGEHAEYGLLEDIMRYVTGFPDTHHHPTEDVVFARLKMRVPGAAKDVDRMLTEHAALLTRSRVFLEAVQAVEVINDDITVFEKYYMGGVLTSNTLTDRTMAGVVVHGFVVRVCVYMLAASRILMRHVTYLP